MAAMAEIPGLALDLAGIALPATVRLAVPLSDQELMAFSRRNQPYRIERNAEGELEIMSPVGSEGSYLEAVVIAQLALWADEHGGMFFSSAGGFRLADGSLRSPDAAWMSQRKWEALGGEAQKGFAPACPEFIVEVLSVHDARSALEEKMGLWLLNGAQLAWMIDPYAETVSVYRPGREAVVLKRPDVVEAESVVSGFQLRMARFWRF